MSEELSTRQEHQDAIASLNIINMLLSPSHPLDAKGREALATLQEQFLRQISKGKA